MVVVFLENDHFLRGGRRGLRGLYDVQSVEERIEVLKRMKKYNWFQKIGCTDMLIKN